MVFRFVDIFVAMATKTPPVYLGQNYQNFTQKSISADFTHLSIFINDEPGDMLSIELGMIFNMIRYSGCYSNHNKGMFASK